MRGWPVATIAFYGPNLSQATKVAVGIVPSETAEPREVRDWKVENGDVRADPAIAQEILDFIEGHSVLSVVMTDGIIGCPHQEGVDYEGECVPSASSGVGEIDLRGSASTDFTPTRSRSFRRRVGRSGRPTDNYCETTSGGSRKRL